ncbi:MAG: ABC transporter substrate-binding protein [Gammaproteobacteria bacterium]
MKLLQWCLGLYLLMFTFAAWAQPDPIVNLEQVANQVIAELKTNKATLKTNPQVVYRIIDRLLLPHVDTLVMSRAALGRDAWIKASADQKRRFAKEFTRLVVRTYASALANYTDEKIEFKPLRENYHGKQRLQVESYIIRSDGPRINLNYRLILSKNQWKVYDMSVDGVSLLRSFRNQFADELSRNRYNIDNLIEQLAQQNAAAGK